MKAETEQKVCEYNKSFTAVIRYRNLLPVRYMCPQNWQAAKEIECLVSRTQNAIEND